MLLGVVFHGALAYSLLMKSIWPISHVDSSRIVDVFTSLSHTFRMPLFFLISGFFSHYLYSTRGKMEFIIHRLKRITLPFLVFWPIIAFAIFGSLMMIAFQFSVSSPSLDLLVNSFENPGHSTSPPLGTFHLWFLYYLTWFSLLATVMAYLSSKSKFVLKLFKKMSQILSHPMALLLLLPLMTIPSLYSQYIPIPAPEYWQPQLWPFGFYGMHFFMGWILFGKQEAMERIKPYSWLMLIICLSSFYFYMSNIPQTLTMREIFIIMTDGPTRNSKHLIMSITASVLSWHLCYLSLILGKQFLNWSHSIIRYLSDASYWIYIIHLPIIFLCQGYLQSFQIPMFVEFLLTMVITFSVGFLTYSMLVKYTWIGWLLKGKRTRKVS